MARFKIHFTEEVWGYLTVEADSKERALDMFWSGEHDSTQTITGGEIQDSIEIEEI